MFVDKRANSVGDILTIVVQESSSANKNDETKTEKQSGWTAAIFRVYFPGFLRYKGNMPSVNYQSDLKHDGSGAINNSQTIVAQVAVKVIDVLPNKSLVIEGKRDTSFGGEHQTIIFARHRPLRGRHRRQHRDELQHCRRHDFHRRRRLRDRLHEKRLVHTHRGQTQPVLKCPLCPDI